MIARYHFSYRIVSTWVAILVGTLSLQAADETISGNLSVTGNTSLQGTLEVLQGLTITGDTDLMGNIFSLQGDGPAAVASFERAIALNPNLHEAHFYFGRHCLAQGDYARATELLITAYHLRPDDYSVLAIAVTAVDANGERGGIGAAGAGWVAAPGRTRTGKRARALPGRNCR